MDFARKHADAVSPVNNWIDIVESNEFTNHNELKAFFPTADYVGNSRYVFNIKGNRYRLVVLVVFISGTMRIKFCGTHSEYDKITDIQSI